MRGWRRRDGALPGQGGFTLIEVMIVVVILGILASIVVPRIMGRPDEARLVKVRADIRAMESALELYRLDNFNYPTANQGLSALVERPTSAPLAENWKEGGYLDRLPVDPWGQPYQYVQPGLHGPFDLYSFGADGRPSGQGINADVGNWETE
ncbi:MAG: type II secretion system protein GspG [Gammaproteobacteria bacterium]|nr:type II secretion system protein GspG [Gammaproteobacteria bacterium]